MSDQQPIIIKRVKKMHGHGHHGGAWKIAYADFVTAMMAFFLLMWLLATTTEEQRRGISDYFENPMRVSLQGGDSVGEQSRVISGGGEDIRLTDGEMARSSGAPMPIDTRRRDTAEELRELEQLKAEIEASIDAIPSLQQFKGQLLLDLTSEGLRIQIVDRENRPMFASGSAQLQPYARDLLRELSLLIEQSTNRISISGHTDTAPFIGGYAGYSNWELSNDRANAARRELVGTGMPAERVMRVVGLSSTVLLDPDNGASPMNRRISIVLMNREAEEAISRDGALAARDAAPASDDVGDTSPAGPEPGEAGGSPAQLVASASTPAS